MDKNITGSEVFTQDLNELEKSFVAVFQPHIHKYKKQNARQGIKTYSQPNIIQILSIQENKQ